MMKAKKPNRMRVTKVLKIIIKKDKIKVFLHQITLQRKVIISPNQVLKKVKERKKKKKN